MSLFSFFRKNKQQSASEDSALYSRSQEESGAGRRRRRGKAPDTDPVDPMLPEKKRARRRLVGAVALVLAAVVGLPMILDSEPKPVADDIAIQIPSKDKAPPLAPAHSSTAAAVAASAALDPKEEIVSPPQAPVAAASPMPKSAPPVAKDAPQQEVKQLAEAPKPAVMNKNKANPAPAHAETKLAQESKARMEDAARAHALLEGKPDPQAAEKNAGRFVIQVAALATKEKVDELRTRLKKAGIKSYTQKIATVAGDRTRIRVGPFANKEEAEKMRAKIVKLGLNGTLVPV